MTWTNYKCLQASTAKRCVANGQKKMYLGQTISLKRRNNNRKKRDTKQQRSNMGSVSCLELRRKFPPYYCTFDKKKIHQFKWMNLFQNIKKKKKNSIQIKSKENIITVFKHIWKKKTLLPKHHWWEDLMQIKSNAPIPGFTYLLQAPQMSCDAFSCANVANVYLLKAV